MAMVSHFVVLVVLAIISVGTCDKPKPMCDEKPFWTEECITDLSTETRTRDEVVCMFEKSGIMSENGEMINADRFQELMQKHVIKGKQEQADAYVEAIRKCAGEVSVKSSKGPGNALAALKKCEAHKKAVQQYLQALCKDAPL